MTHQHRTRTQYNGPRMAAPAIREHLSPGDKQAREKVLDLGLPERIVFKIQSRDTLGLPQGQANREQIAKKQASNEAVAQAIGIDPDALCDRRGLRHTGAELYRQEPGVYLGQFVQDLLAAGYVYKSGSWYKNASRPDPTVNLLFVRNAQEGVEMPESVVAFLEQICVDDCCVWANPHDDGNGKYRVDTINGHVGATVSGPNILRLVDAETHKSRYWLAPDEDDAE